MTLKERFAKQRHRSKLQHVFTRRISCEQPWRKWVSIGSAVVFILTLNIIKEEAALWVGLVVGAFVVGLSIVQLYRRPPQPRWRSLALLGTTAGIGMSLFPLVLWLDDELSDEKMWPFIIVFGIAILLCFATGIYAFVRYRRVKAETAEEIYQMRQRAARRKKLSQI